jgi:hypothetical protein
MVGGEPRRQIGGPERRCGTEAAMTVRKAARPATALHHQPPQGAAASRELCAWCPLARPDGEPVLGPQAASRVSSVLGPAVSLHGVAWVQAVGHD